VATKSKKKAKSARAVPVGELVKLAEERLQRGQPDEAIRLLQAAEDEIRHGFAPAPGKARSSGGDKGRPQGSHLSPHLAAVQPLLPPLMARAFFARARAAADPSQKIADLKEATKRAPSEVRYRLALGACWLAMGKPEQAFEHFEQADQMSPEEPLVERAFTLGLLANGRTREAKERLKRRPEESLAAPLQRLEAIRALVVRHLDAVSSPASGYPGYPLAGGAVSGRAVGEGEPGFTDSRPPTADRRLESQLIASLSRLAAGEVLAFDETYVRTTPKFETSDERYAWLSEVVAVGYNILSPNHIDYRIYRVL